MDEIKGIYVENSWYDVGDNEITRIVLDQETDFLLWFLIYKGNRVSIKFNAAYVVAVKY